MDLRKSNNLMKWKKGEKNRGLGGDSHKKRRNEKKKIARVTTQQ